MEKKKVLIVDDEVWIGKMIEKLIRWDELEMECLSVLTSGREALGFIRQETPDIVITDIRMPEVGGLELIEAAGELEKEIAFIVVSGYKEFEYAQKAMRYGVTYYLLKPINGEELNDSLLRIRAELDAKAESSLEQEKLKDTVEESRELLRRTFLNNIIEGTEVPYEVTDTLAESECYRGIDIKLDPVDISHDDPEQARLTVERVMEITEKTLKPFAPDVLVCPKEYLNIYGLFSYSSEHSRDIKKSISDLLSQIKDYLIGFEQYEVTIGVGKEKHSFHEIRFSIQESRRSANQRLRLGTGRLIQAENLDELIKPDTEKLFAETEEEFRQAIETFSGNRMEHCINRMFSPFMLEEGWDSLACCELAELLLERFFTELADEEETKNHSGELKRRCRNCASLLKLKQVLSEGIGELLDRKKEAAESASALPVRQAQRYIDEHYAEKITLEELAGFVGLNPVYFSVLFKKETDMNFSTYLQEIRMNRARELLTTTNETIAAIGELVGYKDPRYFSQTFTRAVGVKPVLYRKLHS
ncbi:MAG: response regulator [Lachnospiraceae bacterium]|nr:response regulator [Lachnospiraceae bacterium]